MGSKLYVAGFVFSALTGILRALPKGRAGVCGTATRAGVERALAEVFRTGVLIVDGLGSRGLDREAIGVLGIFDLPEVQDARMAAADEFSLSGEVL